MIHLISNSSNGSDTTEREMCVLQNTNYEHIDSDFFALQNSLDMCEFVWVTKKRLGEEE